MQQGARMDLSQGSCWVLEYPRIFVVLIITKEEYSYIRQSLRSDTVSDYYGQSCTPSSTIMSTADYGFYWTRRAYSQSTFDSERTVHQEDVQYVYSPGSESHDETYSFLGSELRHLHSIQIPPTEELEHETITSSSDFQSVTAYSPVRSSTFIDKVGTIQGSRAEVGNLFAKECHSIETGQQLRRRRRRNVLSPHNRLSLQLPFGVCAYSVVSLSVIWLKGCQIWDLGNLKYCIPVPICQMQSNCHVLVIHLYIWKDPTGCIFCACFWCQRQHNLSRPTFAPMETSPWDYKQLYNLSR